MDGQTNLKNVFRTTELPISQKNSIIQSVTDSYDTIKQNLIKGSIKLQIVANVEFEKPGTSESINTHVSTKQHSLTRIEDLDKIFKDNLIADLVDAIDHAKVRGSGWSEATVHKLEMKQTRYHPILGKSFLPLRCSRGLVVGTARRRGAVGQQNDRARALFGIRLVGR